MDRVSQKNAANGPTSAIEWLWGCCYCKRSGGQTTFIQCCPECQHVRCAMCSCELIIPFDETLLGKVVGSDLSANIRTATPDLDISSPKTPSTNKTKRASTSVYKLGVRPKRDRRAQSGSTADTPSKSFACHFYKRSPQLYNPWSGGAEFLKCLYPNPSALRHYL
jgi:hypothetical protein